MCLRCHHLTHPSSHGYRYFRSPGVLLRLIGARDDKMTFHMTIKSYGLYNTKEAPIQFLEWFQKVRALLQVQRALIVASGSACVDLEPGRLLSDDLTS